MILNQKKGLNRNTIDKFYTNEKVVKLCIENIKKHIKFTNDDLIIEPSAGNGSFIKYIKELSNNYLFYDIQPENYEIEKIDFLEYNFENIKKKYKEIHIIGNPPFGRQSSLAIKFIKKCCDFSKSISFILPKSFKKSSMKKYFDLNFFLIYEIDLPENSFLINNIETNVPCIFQIWEKTINKRQIEKIKPLNFKFVKKEESPDISFRRVGFYSGNISKEINNKSHQSHYFIKFLNNKSIDENI